MYGRGGGSGFPSMSTFTGQPNKRKKMEPVAQPVDDMMDDDEWGDLDDDAVEECMVLATQMCSQMPPATNNDSVSRTTNLNTDKINNKLGTHRLSTSSNYPDSGFTSGTKTDMNTSRVIGNQAKMGRGAGASTTSHTNPYTKRFSDFSIPKSSTQKSVGGHTSSRPTYTSGKVYNSIPMKASLANGSHINGKMTASPVKSFSDDNTQAELKKLKEEKAKLEEDVIMKLGEISLLRSELKRKDSAMESERLDRCAALEAAEKKGREKVAKAALEAEAKTKESRKALERLQGELHFKNREVEELTARCRELDQKKAQQASTSPKRVPPGKSRHNFTSQFDFGGKPVSVRSVEVQTEASQPREKKSRSRLAVGVAKGCAPGCRQTSYMLGTHSTSSQTRQVIQQEATTWSLVPEWAGLMAQLFGEQETSDVEKQLMILAIQRLRETYTLLAGRTLESDRLPPAVIARPLGWYEETMTPALSVLAVLNPYPDQHLLALQATAAHLPPLIIKDVEVNKRLREQIFRALENIANCISNPLDTSVCVQLVTAIKESCSRMSESQEIVASLKALLVLASQTTLTNLLCCKTGLKSDNCLLDKISSLISQSQCNLLIIVDHMLAWLVVVVRQAPPWLHSTCPASSKILTCLFKQLHLLLDFTHPGRSYKESEVYRLLKRSAHLVHNWCTVDPDWWAKVADGDRPKYTEVMGAIVANAPRLNVDKQTADLVCELYEVDEAAFDGC